MDISFACGAVRSLEVNGTGKYPYTPAHAERSGVPATRWRDRETRPGLDRGRGCLCARRRTGGRFLHGAPWTLGRGSLLPSIISRSTPAAEITTVRITPPEEPSRAIASEIAASIEGKSHRSEMRESALPLYTSCPSQSAMPNLLVACVAATAVCAKTRTSATGAAVATVL